MIVLDDSQRAPRQMLVNKVTPSPGRLRELLELLERSEPVLQRMNEEDEAERDRCLAKVYGLLIELACREDSEKEAADAQLDER